MQKTMEVFTATVLTAIAIAILVIGIIRTIQNDAIDHMNKEELHYDANGYFVMISADDGLIGVYDGRNPIKHYGCKVPKNLDLSRPIVITVGDLGSEGITIPKADFKELHETVPDETPVLIYERKVEK